MTVATQNKFALLNDDDEGVATTAPAKAPVVEQPPAAATTQPRTTNNRGRAAQPSAQSRSGRYYNRGGAPFTESTDADATPSPNVNAPGQRFDRTEGRPGRGRGRGRGARGGGDRPPRGRYHDRDSQTGRVDTDKATNQGWGADTGAAELGAELQGAADAHAEGGGENGVVADTAGWNAPPADTSGWDAPTAGTTAADTSGWDAPPADASGWDAPATEPAANGEANKEGKEGEERPKRRDDDEEDNTLTLDEYLAKKRVEDQAALPKLDGQRVIKENTEWKGAVQLLKEDSEYFVGKTKSAPKTKPKKEEKVYIPIDLPPAQRENRGRGRGGRGGERGGRGRGGDRGGARGGDRGGERGGRGRGGNWDRQPNGRNTASTQVDVDDAAAFPSLS